MSKMTCETAALGAAALPSSAADAIARGRGKGKVGTGELLDFLSGGGGAAADGAHLLHDEPQAEQILGRDGLSEAHRPLVRSLRKGLISLPLKYRSYLFLYLSTAKTFTSTPLTIKTV